MNGYIVIIGGLSWLKHYKFCPLVVDNLFGLLLANFYSEFLSLEFQEIRRLGSLFRYQEIHCVNAVLKL